MCPPPFTPSDDKADAVQRSFQAAMGQVQRAVQFASGQAAAAGLDPRRLRHLEVAVEEITANICLHAYERGRGEFAIRVAPGAQGVTVEIVDRGEAFDPLSLHAPRLDAGLDDRDLGGMGVYLVRQLVDEVRYRRENDHNVLTLVVRNSP